MTPTTSAVLGSVLGFGGTAVAWASRLVPATRRPVTAPPVPAADLTVWLACHNIACGGHMSTPHTPDHQGTAKCTRCGQIRLDHQ